MKNPPSIYEHYFEKPYFTSKTSSQNSVTRKQELILKKCKICISCIQAAPIKPSDHQLSLADLEAIKVIGKGSSGIVQLVRHKWTEQFFALKV